LPSIDEANMDTTYQEQQDVEGAAQTVLDAAGDAAAAAAERGKQMADEASEGVRRAARYLEETDAADVVGRVRDYFKTHPAHAVIGAAFAGFVIGRMMGRQ
jgi:ElaB/YqjD/DUF883 family membrane-anchored ribosome-binding protein